MRQKKAAMGIGIMIIFISLLLVAAITASVLIYSSFSQQESTLKAGKSAERQVTTGIKLVDLHAMDGSDGAVDDFRFVIKLNPGATPINLESTVMYIDTFNDTLRLVYREGRCTRDVANGYYTTR